MRFTYFLTMAIVAALHASGNALATMKESTQAMISDEASQNIINSVDAAHVQGGRRLRGVEKDGIEELEDESEERLVKEIFDGLKKYLPFTEARAYRKRNKSVAKALNNLDRNTMSVNTVEALEKKQQKNLIYATKKAEKALKKALKED